MRKVIQIAALTLTFGGAALVLQSGALQADEWKPCCAATTQCQTAANQVCDDDEDCTGPGLCCVGIFQCKVPPPDDN